MSKDDWFFKESQEARIAAGLFGHLTNSEVRSTVARLWSLERKQHAPQAARANLTTDSKRSACSPLGGVAKRG